MPFISNNNDNSTIKSSPRNFPQGSYRSYKSFLNQYSNKQQQQQQQQEPQSPRRVSMPIEQSSSSKSTVKNNLSVKNRIFQFDQQQQHQEQKRSYSVPNEQQQQQQQMKNIFDIEKLLSMSSNEIEMLDKDVLERFLRLLMSEEQKSTISSLPIKNEIDVNNNHHHMVDNNNDMNTNKTDEDIDKCKMNLIQSLKQQLERYRQN